MTTLIVENKDLLTIIIAFCSLLTSLLAIVLSVASVFLQQKFNKNSIQPFCDVQFETRINQSTLKISNNGLGVMIINKIYYNNTFENKNQELTDIFSDVAFKTFCEWNYDGSSITANGEKNLYEATFNNVAELDKAIELLKSIEVCIEYSDFYGKKTLKKFPLKQTCDIYIRARKQRRTTAQHRLN